MQEERRNLKARVIAYYLPQFHPIPENDEWWGPGFTEWINVAQAKPLFKGHQQPRIPGNLGFYDLRLNETRVSQAELAKEAGIEGFCYYHYWFGNGKQLLERPFKEVLCSKEPDFPFCLCWANHSWGSKTWTAAKNQSGKALFVEQLYPGEMDNEAHFYSLLDAFRDTRYMTVDGKPLFVIYDPFSFREVNGFINQWNHLAHKHGLKGFHFVAIVNTASFKTYLESKADYNVEAKRRVTEVLEMGFDAVTTDNRYLAQLRCRGLLNTSYHSLLAKIGINRPNVFDQRKINGVWFTEVDYLENVYPTIMPNWDRTPRSKSDSIYVNSTPEVFEDLANEALSKISNKKNEHKIIFLKSWNEWGEGNYMEPDRIYGKGYIEALKKVIV